MTEKKRGAVLLRAHEIINGQRQDAYGNPEDCFALIAEQWSWYMHARFGGMIVDLKPSDVAKMMALFKICRMFGQSHCEDNVIDCCGYLALAEDMESEHD